MKILAFSGSNSSSSINQQLVIYTANTIDNHDVKVIRITDYPLPFYSIDIEKEIPDNLKAFMEEVKQSDGYIISSPEHNCGTPAEFKNLIDWISRTSKSLFGNKPMLLMSTSPGKKGGENNLDYLEDILKYQGADVVSTFSLPSFQEHFIDGEITRGYNELLLKAIKIFTTKLEA